MVLKLFRDTFSLHKSHWIHVTLEGVALDRCFVAHLPRSPHNLRTRCSLSFSCSDTFSPQKGHWIHVTLEGVGLDKSVVQFNL